MNKPESRLASHKANEPLSTPSMSTAVPHPRLPSNPAAASSTTIPRTFNLNSTNTRGRGRGGAPTVVKPKAPKIPKQTNVAKGKPAATATAKSTATSFTSGTTVQSSVTNMRPIPPAQNGGSALKSRNVPMVVDLCDSDDSEDDLIAIIPQVRPVQNGHNLQKPAAASASTVSPEAMPNPFGKGGDISPSSYAPGIAALKIEPELPQRLLPMDKGRRTTLQAVSDQVQLIRTMEASQCEFCMTILQQGEGVMLNSCLHTFCKGCLVSTVQQQDGTQIRCPWNDGSMQGCDGTLLEMEIKALLLPNDYQEYLERSMNQARTMMNIFECKTPKCKGWCEYENGRRTFVCFICFKSNCLSCEAVHEGVDCNTYQKLCKTAKSPKEAQELMNKEMRNGWEQLRGVFSQPDDNLQSILHLLQDSDLFKSTMEFECSICMCDVAVGEGIILQDCLHTFCRYCLINVVKHCEETEVKCPYMDANYSCVNNMKPREIKALVPADVFEQHLARSIKLAESAMPSYHCKTLDCLGWCITDGEDAGAIHFDCGICGKRNCIRCKVIHEGVSCEDYKNRLVQNENDKLTEAALTTMLEKGECMKCSKCKTIVQKTQGCDWIVCTACKTELCWATKGPRWGPKGRGDTTGGCKCDYQHRKPCTPTCQNCH